MYHNRIFNTIIKKLKYFFRLMINTSDQNKRLPLFQTFSTCLSPLRRRLPTSTVTSQMECAYAQEPPSTISRNRHSSKTSRHSTTTNQCHPFMRTI